MPPEITHDIAEQPISFTPPIYSFLFEGRGTKLQRVDATTFGTTMDEAFAKVCALMPEVDDWVVRVIREQKPVDA
jgi:hypothetical protein